MHHYCSIKCVFSFLIIFISSVAFADAPVPEVTNGLPEEAFAGAQVCFGASLVNTGDTGFGPYYRLFLEPGLIFDSASFFASGLTTVDLGVFGEVPDNEILDPRSDTMVEGNEGDRLVLVVLPVGSVVTGGPALTPNICITLDADAEIGVPLDLTIQPVYEFGDTATGANGPIEGMPVTESITPVLFTFDKSASPPESERPPGPSWPYTYSFSVTISEGKVVTDIELNDTLPAAVQYIGPMTVAGGVGGTVVLEPSTLSPGGDVRVTWTEATGSGSGADLTVSFPVYIIDTLDETDCVTQGQTNGATVDLNYLGDPQPQASSTAAVTAKHVALQQSAAPGSAQPGDVITFSDVFQVTDYGTVDALIITDVLSDGFGFVEHASMTINTGVLGAEPVFISPFVTDNPDGTVEIVYDVHAATDDLPPGSSGQITYKAVINQFYVDTGEPVFARDGLSSGSSAQYTLQEGASDCVEGSGAGVTILPTEVLKTKVTTQTEYVPGDEVVWRLTKSIPSGDAKDIFFEDYFPLPVFDVTTIDTTFGVDIVHAPNDTIGMTPTSITVDAPTNSLRIEWPDVVTEAPQVVAVDISVVVQDDPFADDLFLTNICIISSANSDGAVAAESAAGQLRVRAPVLAAMKVGIAASTNPAANATIAPPPSELPIDGNIWETDADDVLTLVATIENTGGAPAYQVTYTDPGVIGLNTPVLISVANALGTALAYTGDLVSGIVLDDPLPAGDGSDGPPYGAETALITYTWIVDDTVAPRSVITNETTLVWASSPTGTLFPEVSDDVVITMAGPEVEKLLDSVMPNPTGSTGLVTAGDVITYRLGVTLPGGVTPGLTVTDQLPAGFEYLSHSVDAAGFDGTVNTTPGVNVTGTVDGGQTVDLSFGATTVNGSANADNNTFFVDVLARANGSSNANTGITTPGQLKRNTASVTFTGITGPAVTDSVDTNYVRLRIDNSDTAVSITPNNNLQGGQIVTVTVTVRNNGGAPAFDLVMPVTVNYDGVELFDLATVTEGTTPGNYSYSYNAATGVVTYAMTSGSLAAGDTDTFTFTVTVRPNVVTGSTYPDAVQAAPEADSQDGVVTEEYVDARTVFAAASTQAPVHNSKVVQATSEPWTTDPAVAIGEVITYELTYTFPEGLTRQHSTRPILRDFLPTGFAYLDGTATIEALNVDTTLVGSDYGVIPTTATAITPTITLSAERQVLEFWLGDITNNDDDPDLEQVRVVYQALVLNRLSNQRNVTRQNTASLNFRRNDGTDQILSRSQTLRIGTPNLAISKAASSEIVAGNDTVEFTVVFTNQTATRVVRAWEPEMEDALPARLLTPSVVSAVLSRGATDISGSAGFTGNTLNVTMDALDAEERYLAPGESITVVYQAVVDPAVTFEEQITNTATGQATSLPGTNGTGGAAPGVPGSDTGERTGTGILNTSGENVNTLNAEDSVILTARRPQVFKASGAPRLQIGATTIMTVEVEVPGGASDAFILTDTLPTGLAYTGTPISITLPPTDFTNTVNPDTEPPAGTNPLIFDFGDINNTSDDDQTITIQYEVVVENILSNQNGTDLINTVELSYAGASAPLPFAEALVTVVEPKLEIEKNITAGASGSDAGDTLSYEVILENTDEFGTAYLVDFTDVLPEFLLGAPGGTGTGPAYFVNITVTNDDDRAVLSSDGITPLVDTDVLFDTTVNTDDTLTFPLFNLLPESKLTITYDVVVRNDVIIGSELTNEIWATYNSLFTGDGRDGSDGALDDDDTVLNNYNQEADEPVQLSEALTIAKLYSPGQPDAPEFTIGEVVSFDLRVDILEGVIPELVVTDVLPAGLVFQGMTDFILGNPAITYTEDPAMAVEGPAGTITVDMGDVANPADGDDTNDFFIIRLAVLVDDVPGNASGATLTNTASVATSAPGIAPAPATLNVTIVEPNLEILKVPSDPTPARNEIFTYTITVRHTSASTADAFEVLLTDVIPAHLAYVPGSFAGDGVIDDSDPAELKFDMGDIALSTQKVFTFDVQVLGTAPIDPPTIITNTVSGEYSSLSGAPPLARGYVVSGSGDITPVAIADLQLIKSADPDPEVTPENTLTYTITVTNLGPSDALNTVVEDVVPAGLTVDSVTPSTGGWVAPIWTVGDLAAGDSETLVIVATVNELADGTQLSNTATAASDIDDPDTDNNSDTVVTTIDANPALTITKAIVSGDPYSVVGDEIEYSFTIENTGDVTFVGPFTVVDDKMGALADCAAGPLAPGATVVCTGTYTVTQADLTAMNVTNVAYAVADYAGDPIQSSTDDATANALYNQINADDDDYSAMPVIGFDGNANVGNVLDNDTLQNAPALIDEVVLSVVTPATPVDPGDPVPSVAPETGVVSVPPGTPPGLYTIEYQICEALNTSNCDTATISVLVICVEINAAAFLEGALIDVNTPGVYSSSMRTDLNNLRVLPGQAYEDVFFGVVYTDPGQPYNVAPWFYNGTEGQWYDSLGNPANGDAGYPPTVVDWVLVSLRDTPEGDGGPLCQTAALLHDDGSIEFVGDGLYCCDISGDAPYYVVVEHRNHLIAMSHESIQADGNAVLNYDFRIQNSYIFDPLGFGAARQKEVLPNTFALLGGNGEQAEEANDDTDITFADRAFWENENGEFGQYLFGDYNLDGDAEFNDRMLWELNNGEFTSVPRN